MDLLQKIEYCKNKGYSIELESVGGVFKCNALKGENVINKGVNIYKTWGEALKQSYEKLYNALYN